MGLLRNARCAVGLHGGKWTLRPHDGDPCRHERRCDNSGCQWASTRTTHASTPWRFSEAGACDQERGCERCPYEEKREHHDAKYRTLYEINRTLGPKATVTSETLAALSIFPPTGRLLGCFEILFCSRCHEIWPLSRTRHQFPTGAGGRPATARRCYRCGETALS